MEACCICQSNLGKPVYESSAPFSITSLCQVLEGRTRVWHCEECGHTQTAPLPTLEKFYAEDYHILTASEEEDQLYEVRGSEKIFRTEHQITTLLEKVNLPVNARVLDYGCGKASTLKGLCGRRDDVVPFVFDVGEQYRRFGMILCRLPIRRSVKCRSDGLAKWTRFSLFALEHVTDPRAFVCAVHGLLKEGGTFYFLVPNIFANTADLVVADHVNHFSVQSLQRLLVDAGFTVREINGEAHNSAWVVVAEKGEGVGVEAETKSISQSVHEMAAYWNEFGDRVSAFEKAGSGAAAIYGSGFYGTFIHASLEQPEAVVCFLDQNPHRQQQVLLGKPIVSPEALPETVQRLYVGLNPRVAQTELAAEPLPELEMFLP